MYFLSFQNVRAHIIKVIRGKAEGRKVRKKFKLEAAGVLVWSAESTPEFAFYVGLNKRR